MVFRSDSGRSRVAITTLAVTCSGMLAYWIGSRRSLARIRMETAHAVPDRRHDVLMQASIVGIKRERHDIEPKDNHKDDTFQCKHRNRQGDAAICSAITGALLEPHRWPVARGWL